MKTKKMEKCLRYTVMFCSICFGGKIGILLFLYLLFFTENEEES